MMDEKRLNEIEARFRAVGLTSWSAFSDEQERPNTNIVSMQGGTKFICSMPGSDKSDPIPKFIEASIRDVPALAAEVRALRAVLRMCRTLVLDRGLEESETGGQIVATVDEFLGAPIPAEETK